MRPAIEVRDLHRSFADVHAVQGLSFSIPRGKVVGFIGANGAGKTTTMRMLATLDYPTSGTAMIDGLDVVNYPSEVQLRLGWMPDDLRPYNDVSVWEYLDFFGRLYDYKPRERRDRIEEVMEFTDLTPLSNRLISRLSKGMGQRLTLGRALIHDPEVLILDEPGAGLDPKARLELKALIRILAGEGKTILISSHILSELSEMCDELLFIDAGKIVHYGDKETILQQERKSTTYRVRMNGDHGDIESWCNFTPQVALEHTISDGVRIQIESTGLDAAQRILKRLIDDGFPVAEFRMEERSLEQAFVDFVTDENRLPPTSAPAEPAPAEESVSEAEPENGADR